MWRLHREISTYYTIQVKRPTDRSDNGCVTVTRKRMDGERTEVNRCDREKERWAKEIRKDDQFIRYITFSKKDNGKKYVEKRRESELEGGKSVQVVCSS